MYNDVEDFFISLIKDFNRTILRSKEQNTIIGGQLLFSIVLASATHQHELATGRHMSPPS